MKTWKDRVKSDYSDIRGVHHGPRPEKTIEQLDRELSYADRLNVNSIRMGGMTEEQWHDDPKGVEKRILDYTRLCAKHGITVMPVLSSGNGIKTYEMLTEAQWDKKRRYLEAMVNLLKPEPNLLMWDVYNEPFCNDYLRGAPKDEYETRFKKIEHDLRKQFEIMRELDDDTPMTVGHELAEHLESTLDLVDVIAFHDYLRTRKAVGETYEYARQCSIRTGGKPVINNEMGCIGRANPYDVELQFCEQYHYGFYIFCLMIEGFWGPLHGIVYPDGTVRDPSIVAAMFGFYRNRGKSRILPQGNREEYASDAIERVKKALAVDKQSLFTKFEAPTEEILEAAENCVNILESCEIVPMDNLLSAQLQELRDDPDVESRRADIKRFAYDMAKKLQEYYCLF